MARKLAAVVFSLGCLQAGSALALGLGELQVQSFLNQPLKASVDLLNLDGLHQEQIKVRLATSDDFDRQGLERNYFLTSITFEVTTDGSGGARILITSDEPVLEPYLDFLVEARWPSGRLLREYTILMDPPVFSDASPVVSASERVAEVEGTPAPAKKNDEFAPGGGTRVDLQKSNLAPGAMPQRSYNAASSPAPAPGSRYMISRDQTLWEIAIQAKPDGTSVHQTMLDIQRLNPDAFINGNINRIKAGYIIYLPTADDISSGDLSAAQAQVRQQNEAWREGRDQQLYARSQPSLEISAESEEAPDRGSDAGTAEPQADTKLPGGGATPEAVSVLPEGADEQERLAALEHQLETLQRIVTLKDDQIAALQSALKLKETGVVAPESPELADVVATGSPEEVDVSVEEKPLEALDVETKDEALIAEAPAEAEVATGIAPEVAPEPESAAVPTPAAAPAEIAAAEPAEEPMAESATAPVAAANEGGSSYFMYIVGAIVLALVGFVYARRRGRDGDEEITTAGRTAALEDVFSEVRLKDQRLELDTQEDKPNKTDKGPRDNRGYGERIHNEYASDIDSADALAEADIYIAYGRHQQAIDLLNNALGQEPGNPVYRLKLLEIYAEMKDHAAATTQLEKLRDIGDHDSIARAESLMESVSGKGAQVQTVSKSKPSPKTDGPGLAPNPLQLLSESEGALEKDFGGLQIERVTTSAEEDGDLDLSTDFGTGQDGFDDEELVIAADSNGLSTKLDLARAYLDMGDDDGARQILDEVVAEGTEELKAEARALLDRIGG